MGEGVGLVVPGEVGVAAGEDARGAADDARGDRLDLGVALIALAGGKAALLASVIISELFYMITAAISGKGVTLEGVLGAALDGYLAAVGFRLFAPVGLWAANKLTPNVVVNKIRAWLISKLVLGIGAGSTTAIATTFARDMVHVIRDGGTLSSWETYLKTAGLGAALGTLGEIGGSVVLSGAFGAARGTVLDKAAEAAMKSARKTADYLIKKGILPSTWTAEATASLSIFKQRMDETMREPGMSVAAAEAMRKCKGSRLMSSVRSRSMSLGVPE